MSRVQVDRDVMIYAKSKCKENILVYRDIPFGSCSRCSGNNVFFTTCIKLSDKKPDEYFALLETISGISVWSEKALLPKIDGSGYTRIYRRKGLLKGLTVEFSSELIGRA